MNKVRIANTIVIVCGVILGTAMFSLFGVLFWTKPVEFFGFIGFLAVIGIIGWALDNSEF